MGGVMTRFYFFPEGEEPADLDNVTASDLERAVEVTNWETVEPSRVFTYDPDTIEIERSLYDFFTKERPWSEVNELTNSVTGEENSDAVD